MHVGTFRTAKGTPVQLDSWTVNHMKAHPMPMHLLDEAMRKVHEGAGFQVVTVDLGRVIGHDGRVAVPRVDLDTPTLFARRKGRSTPSHTVHGEGQETTQMTIIIKQRKKDYRMITAWFGTQARPEPLNLEDENLSYWQEHALLWNPDQYDEQTFVSTWREVLKSENDNISICHQL